MTVRPIPRRHWRCYGDVAAPRAWPLPGSGRGPNAGRGRAPGVGHPGTAQGSVAGGVNRSHI